MSSGHVKRWNDVKQVFRSCTIAYKSKKQKIPLNLLDDAIKWGIVLSEPELAKWGIVLSEPELAVVRKLNCKCSAKHPLSKEFLLPHLSVKSLGNSEDRMQEIIENYLDGPMNDWTDGVLFHLRQLKCFNTVPDSTWQHIRDFIILKIKIKWLVLMKRHNPKDDEWTFVDDNEVGDADADADASEKETIEHCRIA